VNRSVRGFLMAAVLGLLVTVAGLLTRPERTLFVYLTAYAYVASIAVGAILFLSIAHTTGAGWMAVLRRRAEDIASVFPALALLFVPIAMGLRTLYSWATPESTWSEELRRHVAPKVAYLNAPFFVARAALYLVSWTIIAEILRRSSRRQDTSAALALVERQRVVAAATLPWLAFTLTFASFDWLMSLDPTWSSNVLGIYLFAGGFGAASGLVALLVFGPFASRVVDATNDHAHALGRILLTFVIFWTYIAFSQYLLIWIADLPDEIPWVMVRTTGAWGAVAVTLAAVHFVLPFGALLSRALKRRPRWISILGAWLLFAHAVDVAWLVLPTLEKTPEIGFTDFGPPVLVVSLCVAFAALRARGEAPMPMMDPAVARGLRYESTP
jgi:hypothetical protein